MNCCLKLPLDSAEYPADCLDATRRTSLSLVPAAEPSAEQVPAISQSRIRVRPRLFNWITILLLTGWVSLVGIVAELSSERSGNLLTTEAIIDALIN